MPVVGAIIVLVIYIVVIWLFFAYVAKWVFGLGCLAMSAMICYRYFRAFGSNLFWGVGWAESPVPPEPAYRNYFFNKGWQDYLLVARQAWPPMLEDIKTVFIWGVSCMNPITWCVGVTVWAVGAVSAVCAAAVLISLGLTHLAVVSVFAALAHLMALLLRLAESANLTVSHIRLRCPACSQPLGLPVYFCPKCGVKHDKLVPGAYGSLYRRCQCDQELPTLFLIGRNKLHSTCRRCNHVLNTDIGTMRDLYVPIVGGTSSGKSSVLTATLVEFQRGTCGVTVTFPKAATEAQSIDKRNYDRARAQYLAGQTVDKTSDSEVKAFLVTLEDARRNKCLLYAYDAAGEIFRPDHQLGGLGYYDVTHGLIFLVDPFSLPGVRSGLGIGSGRGIGVSADAPKDIFDRVVTALRSYSKNSDIRSIPVAIVVSKTDALGIRSQIFRTMISAASTGQETPDQVYSRTIREWLISSGESPLIRSAEQIFKNVRYFECSALGRVPEQGVGPFYSTGVVDPWAWVLGHYGLKLTSAASKEATA